MTRIGTVDQVLLLLREQLDRAGRKERGSRASRLGRAERADVRPLERVRVLAALDALGEEEKRRALIRGLLAEELGEAVGSDAALQALADNVARIIGEMPGGAELFGRALAQLRGERA